MGKADIKRDTMLESEHLWTLQDSGFDISDAAITSFFKNTLSVSPNVSLRKVNITEFEPYIESIESVIDKYTYQLQLGPQAMRGMPVLESDIDAENKELDEIYQYLPLKPSSSVDRLNRTRLLASNPQAMLEIPQTFTAPQFDLCDPDTFSRAVDYQDIIGLNNKDSKKVYLSLQEKLTHYRDSVEIKLLEEISQRSESFFDALSGLKELECETKQCIDEITFLRSQLTDIHEESVKKKLNVIRLKQQIANKTQLYGAVKLIAQIQASQPVIEVLVKECDYVGALDLIEETALLMSGGIRTGTLGRTSPELSNVESPLDLRKVSYIAPISEKLNETLNTISLDIESAFFTTLSQDTRLFLGNDLNKSSMGVTDLSISSIKAESYTERNYSQNADPDPLPITLDERGETLKRTLTPLVFGLIRLNGFEKALQAVKDIFFKELKDCSKKVSTNLTEVLSFCFRSITSSRNPHVKSSTEREAGRVQNGKLIIDAYEKD